MRIVSLLPSTTEIVCDLGLADDLIGVTIECNWPAGVQEGREIVVRSFAEPSMTPGEIDAIVHHRLSEGQDLYTLDDEALQRCDPDLILSQDLCRVCAVASGDVEAAKVRLNCRADILQIDPLTLSQVLASIATIAGAAGAEERGRAYIGSLHARLAAVEEAVHGEVRRRVFVLEWIDPPFGAGHWVPDLVRAAGGEPILSRSGERSESISWEEIAIADPDVVIVSPCGYGLEQSAAQAQLVLGTLPTTAEVWAIDADAVMVRPGPRLVEGVEALASLLHGTSPLPTNLVARIR
ncbi:MAG: ABC transporter substrate-binding protein [Acidimicrobiales bacterium]